MFGNKSEAKRSAAWGAAKQRERDAQNAATAAADQRMAREAAQRKARETAQRAEKSRLAELGEHYHP